MTSTLTFPRIRPTGDLELDRRLDDRLRATLDRIQSQEIREREIRSARNQFGAGPWPESMSDGIAASLGPCSRLAPTPRCLGPDSSQEAA